MRRHFVTFAVMGLLALAPRAASATVIDFETFTGGPLFGSPATLATPSPLHFATTPSVDFSGGKVLTNTLNLPADETSVYGTASGVGGSYTDPLTLTFSSPITNFFLDVFNGIPPTTAPTVSFILADNNGHSATFALADNHAGGTSQVGFAASGNIITITALAPPGSGSWDFFIDNVHFNEALPGTAVPEPASLVLFGTGVLVAVRRFRRKTVAGR
jgi:hypothetical protein